MLHKQADELTSWEFIKDHLYDRVKTLKLSKTAVKELIRVYREDWEARPAAGEKLLLVFRNELEERFGYGDRFGDGCEDFLIGMIENSLIEYTSRSAFLEQVCAAEQAK